MQTDEIGVLIEELESRMERLRALYDQYFMGIEKIEPSVLRKDVDRRMWVLHRQQIRNTAQRFKLNAVVQRYTTYQQHWMRVCREIENGTYKRDVRRAAKQFGEEFLTVQARKRHRKLLDREERDAAESAAAEAEAAELEAFEIEIGDDGAPPERPAAPSAERKRPATHVISLDELAEFGDVLGLGEPAMQQPLRSETPGAHAFGAIGGVFGDDDGSQARPTARAPTPPAKLPTVGPLPAPTRLPSPTLMGAGGSVSRAAGVVPPPPKVLPPPVPATPAAAAAGLARTTPLVPAAAAPPIPQHAPAPAIAQSLAAARVAPPPPALARSDASTSAGSSMSDVRVREIYSRYVQAKRECRESTAGITEDGLARSLRATADKLRAQHTGRNVDFDVVIKDGKAVLKPVVRS